MSEPTPEVEETAMAQYMILIYETEESYTSPEDWQRAMQEHGRFTEQVVELGGKIVGGEALEPTATATTIRGDVVTDGPFVETKEALGGFYIVEARDLDHALAIAKLCPAGGGGVEVRPVMDVSGD
ncbi:MAG TPA: YciI family protein [Jiangellales bacterium]|nr:YciI family protein [Jiangellales bacterium]